MFYQKLVRSHAEVLVTYSFPIAGGCVSVAIGSGQYEKIQINLR